MHTLARCPKTCAHLEIPVFIHGLDGPIELLAQSLREEALDGDIELLGEDDGKTRVDVVLKHMLAKHRCHIEDEHSRS